MPRKPTKKRLSKEAIKAAADRAEGKVTESPEEHGPLNPPETKMGRPTKYKPEYAVIARKMCMLGATDMILAETFGVKVQTLWNWQGKHEEFFDALNEGKEAWDSRVERGLYNRAVGYSYNAQKIFNNHGEPLIVDYVEHLPPDPGAAKMWLASRNPQKWSDKTNVNLSGTIETKGDVSKLELARFAALLFAQAEREQAQIIDVTPDDES